MAWVPTWQPPGPGSADAGPVGQDVDHHKDPSVTPRVIVRRPGMTRPVVALIVVAAAATAGALGLAWLAARSLVMPARRPLRRTPADLGLAFESIDLARSGGDQPGRLVDRG